MRTIPEWIARNDDQAIPDKVKWRVFNRDGRICPLCGLLIRADAAIDYHHKVPLADKGQHRESNLVAVHRKCHRLITAKEAHARAEERAQAMSVYGIKSRKRKMAGPSFPKPEPQHSATRATNKWTALT